MTRAKGVHVLTPLPPERERPRRLTAASPSLRRLRLLPLAPHNPPDEPLVGLQSTGVRRTLTRGATPCQAPVSRARRAARRLAPRGWRHAQRLQPSAPLSAASEGAPSRSGQLDRGSEGSGALRASRQVELQLGGRVLAEQAARRSAANVMLLGAVWSRDASAAEATSESPALCRHLLGLHLQKSSLMLPLCMAAQLQNVGCARGRGRGGGCGVAAAQCALRSALLSPWRAKEAPCWLVWRQSCRARQQRQQRAQRQRRARKLQ
jgi:hypothetical protein